MLATIIVRSPEVASATCALMILFTSGVATASFATFGLLRLHLSLAMMLLGLLSTLLGQLGMACLLRKQRDYSSNFNSNSNSNNLAACLLDKHSAMHY